MSRKDRYYFALSLAITLAFVLLGVFVFDKAYLRLNEGFIDLYSSIKFYILEIFGIEHHILPTVELYSNGMEWDILLPSDFETFKVNAAQYFELLFSSENFVLWGKQTGKMLGDFGKIIAIILPCLVLLYFVIKRLYTQTNTDHNKDTIPLQIFKKISKVTYMPLKTMVLEFIEFLKCYNYFYILWIFIWILHINLATIFIESIAYYLYFAVSFRFSTIYVQFCKLFIDLQVFFKTIPLWITIPLGWVLFDKFRKNIAMSKLRHCEAKNCGFINSLPIVSITCGSMGKKKTTIITDMALSQEKMFRQKALEIIQINDMKFPNFPWILFENDIKEKMQDRTIYNLASIRKWIKDMQTNFEQDYDSGYLYGYDYEKYGLLFDDKLKQTYIFDILLNYAQAYFIYIIQSSLLVSNYAIRVDNQLISQDNFPMWDSDFFPKGYKENNKYSHILDFDTLRLGKKVVEDNKNNGSFEFGVVVITEIGKERGNNLELKEIKKNEDVANQKNDLFNSWLKMCRHSATVDNFPFIKVFTDEQRPESWGADARDLADIVTIIKSGEPQVALPFYTLESMVYEWCFKHFISLYYDLRFIRGDNTLFMYLLKLFVSKLFNHNLRVINQYGYCQIQTRKEDGKMTFSSKKKYYLMNKKIYSKRFSTDCFSDYFNEVASKTNIGINDYISYLSEKASVDELKQQHSYFIDSLYRDQ